VAPEPLLHQLKTPARSARTAAAHRTPCDLAPPTVEQHCDELAPPGGPRRFRERREHHPGHPHDAETRPEHQGWIPRTEHQRAQTLAAAAQTEERPHCEIYLVKSETKSETGPSSEREDEKSARAETNRAGPGG